MDALDPRSLLVLPPEYSRTLSHTQKTPSFAEKRTTFAQTMNWLTREGAGATYETNVTKSLLIWQPKKLGGTWIHVWSPLGLLGTKVSHRFSTSKAFPLLNLRSSTNCVPTRTCLWTNTQTVTLWQNLQNLKIIKQPINHEWWSVTNINVTTMTRTVNGTSKFGPMCLVHNRVCGAGKSLL